MEVIIEHENTFRAIFSSGMNLFLGAGFSVMAKDESNNSIPTGLQLKDELISNFKLSRLNNLNLPQIATILEGSQKEAFHSYLRKRYNVSSYDKRYDFLDKLNVKSIFTTNIDNLIHRIYGNSHIKYINDITCRGPVHGDRKAVNFAPLHGSIANDESKLSFSVTDISSSFSLDPDKWHYLTNQIQEIPTVFWGYNLADAGVIQSLSPTTIQNREPKPKWIILNSSDDGSIEYFKALGFFIIIGDTESFLDYIAKINVDSDDGFKGRSTKSLFPEESIPEKGNTPVRPIIEFYLGSDPTWHDVYSGKLVKTSHFHKIVDSINSNTTTIVLGIPASGKTTMMMLVAASLDYKGHKIAISNISTEKADLIIMKLNGEKAVIFIDNFTDSLVAVLKLLQVPNILIVGFERDYNFDLISHRLDKKKCNIFEITELTDVDIQNIYNQIPTKIRNESCIKPVTEKGTYPSLYEVIEENIAMATLRSRYKEVLSQLERESQSLHDLFVMCCYVKSCRTPVSYDMVHSFLRDEISSYQDVYDKVANLGAMITDYAGHLIASDQDHFTPRSTIISDAVMQECSGEGLKRVLIRFHKEVSTIRICNYDIFKKRAFDATNILRKAFPHWEEGIKFIEAIYDRDESPYLLQQGALYLSHRHRYKEAFDLIDKAITQTGGRVFSIKNSHAIILFRANIRAIGDEVTIRQTLNQSMDILSKCYLADKRKTYHALVFADHAQQYWDNYPNAEGRQYLETAKKWLDIEEKQCSWNKDVKRLNRRISDTLRNI